ncbi:MAG: VTT domain-containing protein [Candidatus Falkowbacteria bacterium]|nr:VTT domain-containing protein [Candidatus Falkowbacteria bacterium]
MIDIISLVKAAGYLGLSGIIFAESGLLIGFFLPGDSVLFTAGFLASQGLLDIKILIPLLFVCAVFGDSVGYTFGYRLGPKIFKKEDSFFFAKENIERAQLFFEKHGGKTIILARFIPVVRTFAPIIAGVGKMKYGTFVFYNIIGGLLWAVGLLVLGYSLGNFIPNVDRYLIPIILAIIIISVLPNIIHLIKNKTMRDALLKKAINLFKSR